MKRFLLCSLLLLAACSTGRLVREGTTPAGETFREYSHIPYGYERILYSRDGREIGRQQLHSEANFRRIQRGMTEAELADVIGAGFSTRDDYGDGTHSLTWRYYEGVHKLLRVTFGPDNRVIRYDTEWDPDIYSKNK